MSDSAFLRSLPRCNLNTSALPWARAIGTGLDAVRTESAANKQNIAELRQGLAQKRTGANPLVYGSQGVDFGTLAAYETDIITGYMDGREDRTGVAQVMMRKDGLVGMHSWGSSNKAVDLRIEPGYVLWTLGQHIDASPTPLDVSILEATLHDDGTSTIKIMGEEYTPGGADLTPYQLKGDLDDDVRDLVNNVASNLRAALDNLYAGGGGGGGTPAPDPLYTVTPDTTAIGEWVRNDSDQWGELTTDGSILTLTATYGPYFVRYYYDADRVQPPLELGAQEIVWDMLIPEANAAGMSAGVVLSNTGESGNFNFRIDVSADGNTFGCRFEQDGQANIVNADLPADLFTFGTWHRIRFVRRGASAAAFVDGTYVLGTDSGPTGSQNAVTLLVYGGPTAGGSASYKNITARTLV